MAEKDNFMAIFFFITPHGLWEFVHSTRQVSSSMKSKLPATRYGTSYEEWVLVGAKTQCFFAALFDRWVLFIQPENEKVKPQLSQQQQESRRVLSRLRTSFFATYAYFQFQLAQYSGTINSSTKWIILSKALCCCNIQKHFIKFNFHLLINFLADLN